MPKLRPIGDKILIKRIEPEGKTKGGIVLPDTAKEKPQEGIVVAVGDGRLLEGGTKVPFQVKEKNRVLFSSYAGTEVKIEGEEHLILSEEDILAIVS